MSGTQSTHQLAIKGKDGTGAAFDSISRRAQAASAKLRTMLGGALAAAGAYLSFRAIKSGIDELGKLSDIAQKTSANVGELTQASTALSILGVNGNVDALAKAFSFMEKNTGRSGLQGFYETIDEIGKIPDVAERGKAAMAAFGRSGLEFMPLINAAHDGTDALRGVVAAMPAIPQSVADAGDETADAMNIISNGVKSVWLQAIGAICGWFGINFVGGIREAAAQAAAWIEYYSKIAVRRCIDWWNKVTGPIELIGYRIGSFLAADGGISERWKTSKAVSAEMMREREKELQAEKAAWDEREASWRKTFEDRQRAISNLQENYNGAAKSTGQRLNLGIKGADGEVAGDRSPPIRRENPQIRNSLVMAGSNEARRMAILGPQVQNEAKRQTELLKQIADNTKATADNTEETEEKGVVLDVLDD